MLSLPTSLSFIRLRLLTPFSMLQASTNNKRVVVVVVVVAAVDAVVVGVDIASF